MARGISDVLSMYLDAKQVEAKGLDAQRAASAEADAEFIKEGEQSSPGTQTLGDQAQNEAPPQSTQLIVPLDPQDLLEPLLTWNLGAALCLQGRPIELTPYWVESPASWQGAPAADAIVLWLHASTAGLERAGHRLDGADPKIGVETVVYGGRDRVSAATWHRRLVLNRRSRGGAASEGTMRCRGALADGVEIARSLLRRRPVVEFDPGGGVAASLLAVGERLARPSDETTDSA